MNLDFLGFIPCKNCQEFRRKRKEEDALLRKICEDNPGFYDPNGELPLVFDKNLKRLSHEEILSICDSPTPENKENQGITQK